MGALPCGHWDLDTAEACEEAAVAMVNCTDGHETWRGPLCEGHLNAYEASPDLVVAVEQ